MAGITNDSWKASALTNEAKEWNYGDREGVKL